MTEERLSEIRARLAAATPGKWVLQDEKVWSDMLSSQRNGKFVDDPVAWVNCQRDSGLIAAAPTDLADLIAEVERLREAWEIGARAAIIGAMVALAARSCVLMANGRQAESDALIHAIHGLRKGEWRDIADEDHPAPVEVAP